MAICFAVIGLCVIWERFSKRQSTSTSDQQDEATEKAIGLLAKAHVAESASVKAGGYMKHDTRLALIDSDGEERFAAIIKGQYQIGKDRRRTPSDIESFARAILIEGEDGRFVCCDGRKPGVLKFSGRAREAQSYRLDPTIADKLGIPAKGSR